MTTIIVTNDTYTNREIDHFLSDMKAQLNRIEAQTTKTNGRTTRNEQDISNVTTRINTAIWAFGILMPIILILVNMVFFNELRAIRQSIPSQVSEAIEGYRFQVIK